ncbi:MAG: 50S ribosomal protein L9 [Patescibacteria group bacterium]|nr:50S ribosomal protein L9 [Patescibacteria group bacterium]MDE2015743.1 50S ribosomal protein L9 [Patescibacteria group bacterium]MDE2226800.1 50S ribosomal protein L9 [Patescibacteria group bacterium]
MKVIFLQDVKGIGRRYDVKEVADGYARNFLFVNKFAEPATETSLQKIKTLKKEADKNEKGFAKHVDAIIRELKERSLEFHLKTGADGSVFGSVNKDAILKALRNTGITTNERVDIELAHPLKELGEHKIIIRFKNGAEGYIKILIRSEE